MGLDRGTQALGQFLEQLALFLCELGRHGYIDDDQLIAAPATAQVRNTLVLDMKDPAGLRSGRNFQLLITIQGRDFDLCAERSLCYVDIQVQEDVVLTALEELMRLDVQDQEQASVRPAKHTRTALPCQADLRPAIHACRDLHFLFDRLAFQSTAVASLAGR